MAWSDRESNYAVSYTDLQTSAFSLNPGQSAVTSDSAVDKNNALTLYSLDAGAMTAFSGNNLVPKSSFVAGTPPAPPISSCGVEYNPSSNIRVYTQEVNVGTTNGLVVIDYTMFSLSNGAVIEVQYEGGSWLAVKSIESGSSSASGGAIYYFTYNTSDKILVRTTKYA